MRLIDADALRKEIHMSYSDDLGICEVIDNQPTAYDTKKVIEQINAYPHGYLNVEVVADLTEIIRKGGRE